MNDEEKRIRAECAAAREDGRFFSNAAKPERELWVVGELLRGLKLEFQQSELKTQPENSEVDVSFRDARFQVKELTEPGLKRFSATA